MTDNILNVSILVVSVLLIVLFLMQNREGGLSSTFGGTGGFYGTRRGVERLVFFSTWGLFFILAAMLFFKFFF